MPSSMRMAISATTLLGLVLLVLAMSGISSMASDLEAATPLKAPAPATEEFQYRSREIDCPNPKQEPRRL